MASAVEGLERVADAARPCSEGMPAGAGKAGTVCEDETDPRGARAADGRAGRRACRLRVRRLGLASAVPPCGMPAVLAVDP